MRPAPLDPAPRSYPAAVTLLRRSQAGRASVPPDSTLASTEAWLLEEALAEDDLLSLFQSLAWRLVVSGVPLVRASLHTGTLHPQFIGFVWNWALADGLCDESQVAPEALESDAYRRNPIFQVLEHGETIRCRTDRAEDLARYPLIADLARQEITDYTVFPLRAGGPYHNAASLATDRPGGFTPAEEAALERIARLMALHVERHILQRIAGTVLDTYLGPAAGGEVLRGTIRRGSGRPIRAIIWVSDLRGFTDLADRLSGPDMITLLNAYFERLAGAVLEAGGEVLKFIGDGLLAVFPYSAFPSEAAAAEAALAAARAGLAAVAALDEAPPPALAAIPGWRPLRSGIALHEGEVFFGNVGAPERLDFTVIGPAINAASRVEGLSKTLGQPLLLTGPVARHIREPLTALGSHALRGLSSPLPLFAPRPDAEG